MAMTMKKKIPDLENTLSGLRNLIREISLNQLRKTSRNESIEISEIEDEHGTEFDHWISSIRVKTSALYVCFKVHFSSPGARMLAAQGIPAKAASMSPEFCHDFIQEYSNQTAGLLEELIINKGKNAPREIADIGIPEKSPSYDLGLGKKSLSGNKVSDCWRLGFPGGYLMCESFIEIKDPARLMELNDIDSSCLTINRGGGIDFL